MAKICFTTYHNCGPNVMAVFISSRFATKQGHEVVFFSFSRPKHEVLDIPNYQGNAVVNYTDMDIPV